MAAAGVLPAAATLFARMRAIDLAYHVRAGELSLRTGGIVKADPFTFTRGGRAWLNQQWGAQLVFASAHRALGWAGVAVTYAAAVGAGFALLYRSCRRAGTDPRTAAVLTLLGFVLGAGALGARPQALAIPLFTGTWLLLERRDRWSWAVPVIALVWANLHGSFVLAPVLVGFAWADDLLARRAARRSALLLVVTVGATFVTPFGPDVWSYAARVVGDETIRSTIAEWRPPSPLSAAGGLFWLSGVAVVGAGFSRRTAVRAIDVARLVLFFAMGATALRSTLWWGMVAPPVVAGWYPAGEPRAGHAGSGRERVRALSASAAIVALLPIGFAAHAGTDPVTGAPERLAADAPQVLVDATRRASPAGSRLLVFQPFASWFEFALPADLLMVDSRIELFPDDVWHDYDTVIVAAQGWEHILDRYRVDGVVLPANAMLAEALSNDPGWRRTADRPAGSVFVRI